MAGLTDLFGEGSAARQLFTWQVLGGIASAVLDPVLTEVQQVANLALPNAVLSPADYATAVVRNFTSHDHAALQSRKSGVDTGPFDLLVALAGAAPAPVELADALRRGIIQEKGSGVDSTSFEQGMAEGALGNKWTPVIKALAMQDPTPGDALNALLQGQISEKQAHDLFARFGGNPDYFTMLYNTNGSAPTPVQAADMANRGVIGWSGTGPDVTSYEQAFLEGPWRNKWLKPFQESAVYLPPPRTITAMYTSGALTRDRAAALLAQNGLDSQSVAEYLGDSSSTSSAAQRDLTVAQVVGMYEAQLLSDTDAHGMLVADGYTSDTADMILAYADLRREIQQVTYAVGRVRSLYVAHKLTRDNAISALNSLGVPPANVDGIVGAWDVAEAANVKQLTEAQVASAFAANLIDQATAQAQLETIGYTPHDAWILLSLKHKSALPNEPAPGPGPVG